MANAKKDVIYPCFGGVINLSREARRAKVDQTPGWKIFEDRWLQEKNCHHQMKYLTGSMTSSYQICVLCGYSEFDGGYPE